MSLSGFPCPSPSAALESFHGLPCVLSTFKPPLLALYDCLPAYPSVLQVQGRFCWGACLAAARMLLQIYCRTGCAPGAPPWFDEDGLLILTPPALKVGLQQHHAGSTFRAEQP